MPEFDHRNAVLTTKWAKRMPDFKSKNFPFRLQYTRFIVCIKINRSDLTVYTEFLFSSSYFCFPSYQALHVFHLHKDKMPKIWNKYSQKRNIGASVPISTFMCLWANYIFPRWVCLVMLEEICRLILGIYKSLKDTWMWKLGLWPRYSQKRNI